MKKLISFLLLMVFVAVPLYAATVKLHTTYQNGSVVTATNLNGNFTAITAQVNGGLDNDNANTASGYRFFETRSSLPTNGNQGRVVFNTSNNTLNFDNGSSWQTTVTPSGTPSTGYIPYYNSGWTLLAPGSQYLPLVSNGASSLPSYQALNLANGVTSTLAIGNGGTGQTTAQAAIDALLPSQSGKSGYYLTSNGTTSSWGINPSLSNVLFQKDANVDITGSGIGEIAGTTLTPTTTTGNYRFVSQRINGNGYGNAWSTKWKKVAGVSTVTVYAQTWLASAIGGNASVKVDVGGQNSSVSGTLNNTSPEWVHFTIDVSSLTNGTVYDVTVSLAHLNDSVGTANIFLGNLISFGS